MTNLKGGLITALITPFKTDGSIDYDSLGALTKDQIKKGVEGFVISGTTGESPNLSQEEVKSLYLFVRELAPTGIQIIIGAGTNSTYKTLENVKFYDDLKPDAYLLATPYYNKPSQSGLFKHFKTIANSTDLDILLYDIPGRSIVEISVETTLKLSKIFNIVGIKDATGNLEKLAALKEVLPKEFLLLSGDDDSCADFIEQGGHGVISVLSHLVPREILKSLKSFNSFKFKGNVDYSADYSKANYSSKADSSKADHSKANHSKYKKLGEQIFMEPSPAPVKSCLKMMGLIEEDHVRLPLVTTTRDLKEKLKSSLRELELLND